MTEEGFKLYVRPTFIEGIARLVDFTRSLNSYNTSRTPEEADSRAISSDWEAVGNDLMTVIKKETKRLQLKKHE